MKKNHILALISAMVMSVAATSCDDYLDVNKNVDAPDNVPAYLYLPSIEQNMQGFYWDIRALGPLTQMMGTGSYTNFANQYYTAASDAAGEVWRVVYWNQGMNLENLISQSEEAENWTMAGIGYIIKAYGWDKLTKYHGDVVLKEAFINGQITFPYDSQQDVYAAVQEWAKKGVELLQREDNTNYYSTLSGSDYIFHGDKDKWIKFAYSIIVSQLTSLTQKNDFKEKYYPDLVKYAALAMQSNSDNATLEIGGGGNSAAYSAYNNFWSPIRGNLAYSYYPHDYAVSLMTGTIRKYNESNGDMVSVPDNINFPYELADKQIVCDTLAVAGHLDPRNIVKLPCTKFNEYSVMYTDWNADGTPKLNDDGTLAMKEVVGSPVLKNDTTTVWEKVRSAIFRGGTFTSYSGPLGTAPNFYGYASATSIYDRSGKGRWIYYEDAPYILMTYPEILFDLAEAHFVAGNKAEAFEVWKKAIAADMEFTKTYIRDGQWVEVSGTMYHQGDWISKADFQTIADEYLAGPYVGGLSIADFSLSHIMMQKFDALFPWGAAEAWVDQRKYFYDIDYSGEYPYRGNGYDVTTLNQKKDSDPTKVYKGFYLAPAQVQGRKLSYNTKNQGAPCFRVRPRYNSEYVWNKRGLNELTPIPGTANCYQTSIPWFAYPGEMPTTMPGLDYSNLEIDTNY